MVPDVTTAAGAGFDKMAVRRGSCGVVAPAPRPGRGTGDERQWRVEERGLAWVPSGVNSFPVASGQRPDLSRRAGRGVSQPRTSARHKGWEEASAQVPFLFEVAAGLVPDGVEELRAAQPGIGDDLLKESTDGISALGHDVLQRRI